ncbi:MADS-box transcription factor PHERES 1-like [Impatiens glandulifera]|uniref:MADS-box transcription factor PHERES 1-like n=1 Tax=Impatiens glandulifera TaxID=253017 RepID=UPI001FB1A082|nr:MADS-box transcription factor PHERES 1-like [Impatiens glandulifera]
MRRGKVKLAFIQNANARQAALTKKAVVVSKMAAQLEILCGVSILFSFFNINDVEPVEVFPSLKAVKDFMSYVMNLPIIERTQKATTQDVYLNEMITKKSVKLQNLKEKNNRSEGLELLRNVFEGNIDFNQIEQQTLYCTNQVIVEKIEEINKHKSQNMNNPLNHNNEASDDARFQVPGDQGNFVPNFHPPTGRFV